MAGMTADSPKSPEIRDDRGRFVTSAGRKPGSRNRVSQQAIAELRSLSDDAFRALRENVSRNDQRAVEFILSRVLPSGRLVEMDLTAEGISEAVAEGEVTLNELKQIAGAASALKNIGEIDQMRRDIEELRKLLCG
ncbi:hypothetical protein MLD63_14040 [Paracoccus sp. TK19116]|uniref:Uncharacterized protein n=2 Tax=Paracoccus albicereus TaxID=2922394 RepID=A0ABT1MTA8_9RHOB|nr:hypothetical protein [Paracoccus albicereus]